MNTNDIKTPKDILPDGFYKVVQITIDGTEGIYFVEDKGGVRHAMILRSVLDLEGISYNEIRGLQGIMPDIRGDRYFVSGMGGARVLAKLVLLFGSSMDYGVHIAEGPLEMIQINHPEWRFKVSKKR